MRNALLRDHIRGKKDPIWFEIFNQIDKNKGSLSRAKWIKNVLMRRFGIKEDYYSVSKR